MFILIMLKTTPIKIKKITMAGYLQMVRSETMSGKFCNNVKKPLPFKSNKVEKVNFELQDCISYCSERS